MASNITSHNIVNKKDNNHKKYLGNKSLNNIKEMRNKKMANLSDAHGIITVKARTKEIGNKVMDIVFRTQET